MSYSKLVAICLSACCLLGACEKKQKLEPSKPPRTQTSVADAAVPTTPVENPFSKVDISKLSASQKTRYAKLLKSLVSPCNGPRSLLASRDKGCKRAPYAAGFVAMLLGKSASNGQIMQLYAQRYVGSKKPHTFSKDGPRIGPAKASIEIVEFFDYLCGACIQFYPVLKAITQKYGDQVAVYYKLSPRFGAPSKVVGQAAWAAHRQGKFAEMNTQLFAAGGDKAALNKAGVERIAAGLGLQMAKFRRDYAAAAADVGAQEQEGIVAGVHGTPTVFINGRQVKLALTEATLSSWIDEELAVGVDKENTKP